MRKTKIICTLGPATDRGDVLEQLIKEGMNVARFNFSHGDHEEQRGRIEKLRSLREKCGQPVAALLDTKGPEIRLRDFEDKKVMLEKGQTFILTGEEVLGNKERASITYENLWQDVTVGTKILIDDGLIGMQVDKIENKEIYCTVLNDGAVSNHKGINVPGIHLAMEYLSEKDRQDILFGIREDMDFVAASFVRSADDVLEIRRLLDENGGWNINIIAKIENGEGVENIDSIIEVSDGIMIARGDMGVEIPCEEVPVIQKMIIKKVYKAGKQVITATQMLDSMMKNPRPTRAETTDVANAIYDGTSAIMLSGETAAGKYPVEALKTMVEIAQYTEQDIDYEKRFRSMEKNSNPDVTDAISHATCMTAIDIEAPVIITVTKSGRTARMISKYRPDCPIIGCTPALRSYYQMSLSWGVHPVLIAEATDTEELFLHAMYQTKKKGYIKKDDFAVITAGVPVGISGATNLVRVEKCV